MRTARPEEGRRKRKCQKKEESSSTTSTCSSEQTVLEDDEDMNEIQDLNEKVWNILINYTNYYKVDLL